MHDLSALQDVLILLVLALLNAWLFSLLRQSPIVGYLTTGCLLYTSDAADDAMNV
mgnify:CR=1 FL=1